MYIGAHLSIAGGHINALQKIVAIGGNCLQIFSASPRGWNFAELDDPQMKEFRSMKESLHIHPVYFHASYLINLADTGRIAQLSKNLLIHELKLAAKMGVKGSVIHLGSYKDNNKDGLFNEKDTIYESFISDIKEILRKTPAESLFIIENAGNRKIGLKLEEIREIIQRVNNPRVRVCLDTCHLHAAGYSLNSSDSLASFLTSFDNLIGLRHLELIHLNDSKDVLGSFRDRHENIGQGNVGSETFQLLVNHPQTKNLPFILEVPGFDDKGPDAENISIVKNMAK